MSRITAALKVATLTAALCSGPAYAQQTPPPAGLAPAATTMGDPARPAPKSTVERKADKATATATNAWDKTKAMTRKQWNEAKKTWAMEKQQWRDCTDQAKREKLAGTKRWSFIGNCMTKS